MNAPAQPTQIAHVLARKALDEGDAALALRWADELPDAESAPLFLEIWILAGSPRAVARLAPSLTPALRAIADAFVQAPPVREVATSSAADPYAALTLQAEQLASLGRAAELAMTHLGLADVALRSDWAAVHIQHASSLAMGLGDGRIEALVRAYEARSEASFGDYEEALEAAVAAIALGHESNEPRAIAIATPIAELARAQLAAVAQLPEASETTEFPDTDALRRASEPQDV